MKSKIFLLLFMSISLCLTACQEKNKEEKGQGIEGQSVSHEKMEDVDPNDIANHLAKLSTDVPDVESATAIVVGPYVLVGIDINGDIEQSEVGSIKYQVAEALAHDPYGANAIVTADPDIIDRIEEMRKEMAEGRPGQALMDELAAIIGRIIPIVPGEEHRKAKEPTNVNKEKMNEGEEKELENIQEKQSKGRMKENEQ